MTALSPLPLSGAIYEVPIAECEDHVAELEGVIAHLAVASAELPSAAVIVHEVAQPVTAATNYLAVAEQLLSQDDAGAASRGLVALRHAQQCLTRTSEVMANLRDGGVEEAFDPRPQELNIIVADAIQLFHLEAASAPVVDIPSGASRVMGDCVQLGQVVSNLIRNAIEATEGQAPCPIRIGTRLVADGLVEVRIEDDGPGISEKMKGLLFSAFASTKPNGTGIGLSICRAIIEQHHGRIWAEDLPNGAAFCFTLPSCGRAPRRAERRRPPRRPSPAA